MAADCHELTGDVAIASPVETEPPCPRRHPKIHEPSGHEPRDHKRVSHWDRPKPPHDWRWVVGGIGRTLITLGLLMFGFVAYQLWGTGIQTAQAQRQLVKDFDKLVGAPSSSTTTSTTSAPPTTAPTTTDIGATSTIVPATSTTTTTTTLPAQPPAKPIPADGEGVARLEIPRMGLHRIVVEGATAGDLAKGPGHFPETPLPGQLGNAAIAGHRTTHGHPFYDIDELRPGDEIIVTTLNGRYVYGVTDTEVVSPDDYADVIPTTDATKATLTLVSCTPRYSSTNRIVVHSELLAEKSDPLTQAAPITLEPPGSDATLPDEGAGTSSATVTDDSSTRHSSYRNHFQHRRHSAGPADDGCRGRYSARRRCSLARRVRRRMVQRRVCHPTGDPVGRAARRDRLRDPAPEPKGAPLLGRGSSPASHRSSSCSTSSTRTSTGCCRRTCE